jgi:hypothetical protein
MNRYIDSVLVKEVVKSGSYIKPSNAAETSKERAYVCRLGKLNISTVSALDLTDKRAAYSGGHNEVERSPHTLQIR